MSEPIAILQTSEKINVEPETLARWFWNMSDVQQAEFFHALADVVGEQSKAPYGYGEMQWCYMAGAIKKRSKQAWNMYLAVSGFAYQLWDTKPDHFDEYMQWTEKYSEVAQPPQQEEG